MAQSFALDSSHRASSSELIVVDPRENDRGGEIVEGEKDRVMGRTIDRFRAIMRDVWILLIMVIQVFL